MIGLVESAIQSRESIRRILQQVANKAHDVVCRRRRAKRRQKEWRTSIIRLFSKMEDPWWSGGLTTESIREVVYEIVVNQSFVRYERRERARKKKESWRTDHLMEVEGNKEQEELIEILKNATTDLVVTDAEMYQEEYMAMVKPVVQEVGLKIETTTSTTKDIKTNIKINDVLLGSHSVESNLKARLIVNDNDTFVSCKSDQGGSGRGPGGDRRRKSPNLFNGGKGLKRKPLIPVTKSKKRKTENLMLNCNKITDYFNFNGEPAQGTVKRQKMAPGYLDLGKESAQPADRSPHS